MTEEQINENEKMAFEQWQKSAKAYIEKLKFTIEQDKKITAFDEELLANQLDWYNKVCQEAGLQP